MCNVSMFNVEEHLAARFGKEYQLLEERTVTSLCLP